MSISVCILSFGLKSVLEYCDIDLMSYNFITCKNKPVTKMQRKNKHYLYEERYILQYFKTCLCKHRLIELDDQNVI